MQMGTHSYPEIQGQLELGEPFEHIPRNVPLMAPLVIQFPQIPVIQRPGEYWVEILLDGRHLKSLPFAAAHPPPN